MTSKREIPWLYTVAPRAVSARYDSAPSQIGFHKKYGDEARTLKSLTQNWLLAVDLAPIAGWRYDPPWRLTFGTE